MRACKRFMSLVFAVLLVGFPVVADAGGRPNFQLMVGTIRDAKTRTSGWDEETTMTVVAGKQVDPGLTAPWSCAVAADPRAENPKDGSYALAVECKLANGLGLRFGTSCSSKGRYTWQSVDLQTPIADKVRLMLTCFPTSR